MHSPANSFLLHICVIHVWHCTLVEPMGTLIWCSATVQCSSRHIWAIQNCSLTSKCENTLCLALCVRTQLLQLRVLQVALHLPVL